MTDSDLTKETSLIESLPKLFAFVLGLLYLLGFLVVAYYLSRYGVSSFSVLQLQYLVAGIWVLGPPALYTFITHTKERFDQRVAPDVTGKFNWRRFAFSLLLTGIPGALFFVLLAGIPTILESLTWWVGISIYLFYLAMLSCAHFLWLSWQTSSEKETRFFNRSHAAPFYLALLFMIVIFYAVWFSGRIYPLIPFSLGGGKPLTVVFFEGEKKMPDVIQKTNPSAKTSIPYKLLLTTDKSFVVVSPIHEQLSIEISRDSVAGMVVVK